MKSFKNSIGNEVKIFAQTFEQCAWDQVKKLADYEAYLESKIRIMPDAHAGKGCTIGTTMEIKGKITPNLVGVDIGCGMLTIKLKDTDINFEKLDNTIRSNVPSGFKVHKEQQVDFNVNDLICKDHVDTDRARLSIGSLGGGNHFIEVSKSENDGSLYLIIHSGSRKLGIDICKHYQNLAVQNVSSSNDIRNELITKLKKEGRSKDINSELKKLTLPRIDDELAYLEGEDFDNYIHDMYIAQKFAIANRKTIADIIIKEYGLTVEERFETIHNYIDFGRMILRKGAVSAEKDEILLIPINMKDGSLLCKGKGNIDWNYSAPHGAGRLMSRSKAKEYLSMDEFKDSMSDIYSTSVHQSTLDEAPMAYKSIEEIKGTISDTVEIIDVLKPLYNFKAH